MCLTALGTFLSLSLFLAFNFEIANNVVFSVCLLKIIMESGIAEPEDRGVGANADQLTLSHPGRADYADHSTTFQTCRHP